MAYLYLFFAIVAEVIGTTALKSSEGFTKLFPSMTIVVGYSASFYFLSLVLKVIPVGIAYAIWSGVGIVLITIVGGVMFRQVPDFPAIIGITLILAGVVVIQLFSNTLRAT